MRRVSSAEAMNFVGMSERNFVGSFLDGSSTCHTDNCGKLLLFFFSPKFLAISESPRIPQLALCPV